MFRSILSICFSLLICPGMASDPNPAHKERLGVVRNTENGEVLQQEHTLYRNTASGKEICSKYFANDQLFAKKEVMWNGDGLPSYSYQNYSTGAFESITPTAEGIVINYKKNGSSPLEKKVLDLGRAYCYDEGLIEHIKANWETLKNGKELTVAIVVPHRLDYYNFKINYQGAGAVKVVPDNFLLRQFAPSIDLSFSSNGEFLQSLQGVTHIQKDASGTESVSITYTQKLL